MSFCYNRLISIERKAGKVIMAQLNRKKKKIEDSFSVDKVIKYSVFGAFVFLISLLLFNVYKTYNYYNEVSVLLPQKEQELRRLDDEFSKLQNFDPKEEVKEVKQMTVNAQNLGKKVVTLENDFFDHLFIDEVLDGSRPFSKEENDRREEVKKQLTQLFAGDKSQATQPWKRNKDWNIQLETTLTYASDSLPVIFTIKNKKGELMGTVRAHYVSNDKDGVFRDIQYALTAKGHEEEKHLAGN